MKLVPYKGVRVRKIRPGEIEKINATIQKIKAMRAKRLAVVDKSQDGRF